MSAARRLFVATIVSVGVLVGATTAGATSLLDNGDFSSGNTGFTSAYTFNEYDCWNEASYDIVGGPNACHSLWAAFGDHTTGTGHMLVVNGARHYGMTTGGWQRFEAIWDSTTAGGARLGLINLNTELDGNDFAVDDIAIDEVAPAAAPFTATVVPEPATMTLVGIGFVAAAMSLRRLVRR